MCQRAPIYESEGASISKRAPLYVRGRPLCSGAPLCKQEGAFICHRQGCGFIKVIVGAQAETGAQPGFL